MNKRRKGWTSVILFLIVLSIGLFFFFKTDSKEKRILNEGKEITATVDRYFKSTNIRGGKIWRSVALYNIDKKTYHYNIEAKVPIGKTFRLRYLPENPELVVLINPDEFKNYPKSY